MHNSNVIDVIFNQDELADMQVLDYFLECERCHYIWAREIDYRTGKIADPVKCRCCRNPWFTSFKPGAKKSLEGTGILAWKPIDDQTFIARPDWLKYCADIRKSTGNPLLPVAMDEFMKNRNYYIRLRNEFMKNLKANNPTKSDEAMVVYKFFTNAPETISEVEEDQPINKTA